MTTDSIQSALDDIMALRKTISVYQTNKNSEILETSFSANSIIQRFTLALCLIQIFVELAFNHLITTTMIEKNSDNFYRVLGVTCIASVLALCVATLYFLVWRAAQRSGEDLSTYIRRNFSYMQNLSTVSDLFMKFVVVSMLIFFQHVHLVAPFLFLCIGDYLMQGRFFTLHVRTAMYLAIGAFAASAIQFYLNNTQVLWPLLLFALVNVLSLKRLQSLRRIEA